MILLVVFGLLIIVLTVIAVRFSRNASFEKQKDILTDDLETIAEQIDQNLDEGEVDYSFLELTSSIEKKDENYSYLLRDSTGTILSPSFVAGKHIRMNDVRYLSADSLAFTATVWGVKCFVIVYHFPDRPLELIGIYDNDYIFDDVHATINSFILLLSAVFVVLLLIAWIWVIPALERMFLRKNQAEHQLQIARELQQKAVTKQFPTDPRCDVYAVLQPAREVGGDMYRCGVMNGKLLFVVGDVSDKGTTAAFVMFMMISVIRSHAHRGVRFVELMNELNALLYDNPEYEMFCTLFMGQIDLETLEMDYCNAGHTRTILDGEFLNQDPQLIVGIEQDYPYHTQHLQLHHGSRLLLYTDGVTEARSQSRSFFGEQRLLDWMRKQPADASSRQTCESLLHTLETFRGKALQSDDIAIMCIKI